MRKKFVLKRRTLVRIISFNMAVVGVLAGFIAAGYQRTEQYKLQIEYGYQRSLEELSDAVGNIDIALKKSLYAGSENQFGEMANKLWMEASVAKTCLSQIPTSDYDLTSTNRFLSQVGDFALSISKKSELDEEITAEEMANLQKLWEYSSELKNVINNMQSEFRQGGLWSGESERSIQKLDNRKQGDTAIADGFTDIEDGFADYPTLIYDGPFSDHLLERESLMLKNVSEVTQETAKKRAAEFLGVEVSELQNSGENDGHLPTYNFSCEGDDCAISVTKAGGVVESLLGRRYVDQKKIEPEQALKTADEFLKSKGYTSMTQSYYETAENICTINYAFNDNGVKIYPDLIKVSVALDTGEVLMFDAKNYIMNNHKRDDLQPAVQEAQAREIVSKNLTIKDASLAIIPSDGAYELLCYEFLCEGKNGDEVLIYINAKNLIEEEILILLIGDDGILTM